VNYVLLHSCIVEKELNVNTNNLFFFLSRYIKQPLPDEFLSSPLEPGACNGSRSSYEGKHSCCGAVGL
jgi:hypothetical protein